MHWRSVSIEPILLTAVNLGIIQAIDRGYHIDKAGNVFNSMYKQVNGYVHDTGYKVFTFNVSFSGMIKTCKIPFHKLQAYIKFENVLFNANVQVRHLNNNALDNTWDNISIGTATENQADKLPEVRLRASLIGARTQRSLSPENVKRVFELKASGHSYSSIMSIIGIKSKSTVSDILNKKLYVYD